MFTKLFKPLQFLALAFFMAAASPSQPLSAQIASGPMLGPVDMREAHIWVQTQQSAVVRILYSEASGAGPQHATDPVQTREQFANCASFILNRVEPGKEYRYQVEVDGVPAGAPLRFQTPAFFKDRSPPPDLRIALGGAHYAVEEAFEPPYRTLGGGYSIFSAILETEPDLMLWLGNTAHLRESDWTSRAGFLKRYSTARAVPELQPLLASIPHYATWGEADYGSPGAGQLYSFREPAETAFRTFWPQPVSIAEVGGLVTRFRRSDVDFFLLDTRSFRNASPTSTQLPSILGTTQIEWLRQELMRSTATFKIVAAGAPILNPAKSPSNLSFAEREHTQLLQTLRDEQIPGLVFVSGGKYYGELTRLVHSNSYNIFDLTVGPLTANPKANEDELNFFRMPGTSTFDRHFALLEVTGPEENRQLTFRVLDSAGTERWNRSVTAQQLTAPAR